MSQPPLPEHPASAPPLAPFLSGYRLPGYDRAFLAVTVHAVQLITYAHLPEPFQHSRLQEAEESPVEQLAGDTAVRTAFPVRHEAAIELSQALDGNYSALIERLVLAAPENAITVAQNMLDSFGRYLDAAGQTISPSPGGSILDMFLDGVASTLMQFDANGRPDFSACYLVKTSQAGIEYIHYYYLLAAIDQFGTPEQQQRLRSIIERQKYERDSRTRHF